MSSQGVQQCQESDSMEQGLRQPELENTPPANKEHTGSPDLLNNSNTLLVVVTLITTLTFQLGVNPPGGFWQDDKNDKDHPHVAGHPIMADKHPRRYKVFSAFSWLSFYFSLFLIAWLLSGKPIKTRLFKFCMIFCLATVGLLYLVCQPESMLRWCFTTWVIIILVTALMWSSGRFYKRMLSTYKRSTGNVQ